jgi:predicted nuclease of restriction endonuclease-like (RecB) superfamily
MAARRVLPVPLTPTSPRRSRGQPREDSSFPVAPAAAELPAGYAAFLADLKGRVERERVRVVVAANSALVLLYWDLGKAILDRQAAEGWGAKVIDRLASDLAEAYPEMKGFSPRNLLFMRSFAEAYPDHEQVKQLVSLLPWGHVIRLLQRIKAPEVRDWYAQVSIREGWSRSILELKIDGRAHERQGKALSNFKDTLPPADSDLASQIFKDPYLFDFLGTADPRREREVELALVEHIQRFLLELGAGFAFVGRQVLLEVGDQDFYIDLLFYHLKLRCFVVIELKAVPFDPAFVGQTNLYLSAVDEQLRHPDDKPTLGLLLCRSKNKLVVEYALRGLKSPIGVADWETRLVDSLPEELKGSLPTIEQLEGELAARLSGSGEAAPNPTQRSPRQARARAEPPAALSAPERKPRGSKAKKQA